MKPFLRSRLITASLMLSAAFSSPAHSQKLLADGIKDLANQIATNVSKEKKQKVAILPFRELDGKPTILGTYISEELVTDLFMIGGLNIVERTMLDRLIGELKLGQTGVIDPDTAKRVGKVAGVDAIVTGSITDLQSYVALNCRLIDAQTGQIFGAAQTKIVKDDDVRKIMGAALPSSQELSRTPAPQSESRTNSAETSGNKNIQQQQQAANFLFELKQCTISGTSVACDFLITNKGEDRDFSCRWARLFDDDGNEYRNSDVVLGGSTNCYNSTTRLVSGVPIRARLSFEGIRPQIKHATLLEFVTYWATLQFRNVPLARP